MNIKKVIPTVIKLWPIALSMGFALLLALQFIPILLISKIDNYANWSGVHMFMALTYMFLLWALSFSLYYLPVYCVALIVTKTKKLSMYIPVSAASAISLLIMVYVELFMFPITFLKKDMHPHNRYTPLNMVSDVLGKSIEKPMGVKLWSVKPERNSDQNGI